MTARAEQATYAPRGLQRAAAAQYVGVGVTKFNDWVLRGVMPKPKKIDSLSVWDRHELDAHFTDLENEGGSVLDGLLP